MLEGPTDGCLSQAQLLTLARLGQRVETLFGAPQDIEFAVDASDTAWLVQARAITTLYPLPPEAPRDTRDLRVYFSFNVAQGVFRPITPLGIDSFRPIGISIASVFGVRRTTPIFKEAGGRLFIDLTPALRSSFWRRIVRGMLGQGEARSVELIEQVLSDPRLAVTSGRDTVAALVRAMVDEPHARARHQRAGRSGAGTARDLHPAAHDRRPGRGRAGRHGARTSGDRGATLSRSGQPGSCRASRRC